MLSRVCAARYGLLKAQLYVEVNGNGPTWSCCTDGVSTCAYDGLVEELRDRSRLIAVDMPGPSLDPGGQCAHE